MPAYARTSRHVATPLATLPGHFAPTEVPLHVNLAAFGMTCSTSRHVILQRGDSGSIGKQPLVLDGGPNSMLQDGHVATEVLAPILEGFSKQFKV